MPAGVEYVPMIGNLTQATAENFVAVKRYQAKHLLGFNELDQLGADKMTPEQAIALWPQFMATGLRL